MGLPDTEEVSASVMLNHAMAEAQHWKQMAMLAVFKFFRANGRIVKREIASAESAQQPFDVMGTLGLHIKSEDLNGLSQLFGVTDATACFIIGHQDGMEIRLLPYSEAKRIGEERERANKTIFQRP